MAPEKNRNMINATVTGFDRITMKKHKLTTKAAAIVGALLFTLMTGCAAVAPNSDDIIAERAQARWDAVLAKDYAIAYAYYSPGFRSKVSVTDLEIKLRLQRVKWTSAKYRDHTCTEDVCTVRVDIGYQVGAPVPGVDVWNGFDLVEEQWVKTDGEWWYIPPKG
jgi:hypothetical protein